VRSPPTAPIQRWLVREKWRVYAKYVHSEESLCRTGPSGRCCTQRPCEIGDVPLSAVSVPSVSARCSAAPWLIHLERRVVFFHVYFHWIFLMLLIKKRENSFWRLFRKTTFLVSWPSSGRPTVRFSGFSGSEPTKERNVKRHFVPYLKALQIRF
jgi:hypothetical protein